MQGGKREGAGRPPVTANLKKEPICVKLPRWLIDWMSGQTKSRAVLIEHALKKEHSIEPPSDS